MDKELATKDLSQMTIPKTSGTDLMIQTREMTEIQAMVISAKRFPRDMDQVRGDILASCASPALAEYSQYMYSKGGTEITGPSIRLAEELANAFTNIDKGWVELERKAGAGNLPGESTIQCFAWDMQRNVKAKRTFTVRHWRDKKGGQGYALKDEREIHELCANQAARRLRACILEIIPKWLQEEAITKCDETLEKVTGPIDKKIPNMIAAFAKIGITKEMLEKRAQRKIETIDATKYQELFKIYNSIIDGMSQPAQWFTLPDDNKAGVADIPPTAPPPQTKTIQKDKPKNFASAEELAKKKEPDFQPEETEGPSFDDVFGDCVMVCREMSWTSAQLAQFAKELTGKSTGTMKTENDVNSFMEVYSALLKEKKK